MPKYDEMQGIPKQLVYEDFSAVTPSDAADLSGGICRGLYCSVAGTVAVHTASGGATSKAITMVAGGKLEIAVKRVLATGTTATVVALY